MTDLESLRSLQKRIREAKGADRELDADIAEAIGGWRSDTGDNWIGPLGQICVPSYTLDPDGLGPCVALMREVLPGAEFDLNTLYGLAHVNLPLNVAEHETIQYVRREDGNKCLAFCEAIISALIAQEEAKHTEKAG